MKVVAWKNNQLEMFKSVSTTTAFYLFVRRRVGGGGGGMQAQLYKKKLKKQDHWMGDDAYSKKYKAEWFPQNFQRVCEPFWHLKISHNSKQ